MQSSYVSHIESLSLPGYTWNCLSISSGSSKTSCWDARTWGYLSISPLYPSRYAYLKYMFAVTSHRLHSCWCWMCFNFSDPPSIKEATSSAAKSWIGQTVTLKCESDGVPTPTLTWYKPDGSQIKSITSTQNTVTVIMSVDQDFGGYKCDADNGLTTDFKIVQIKQISRSFMS